MNLDLAAAAVRFLTLAGATLATGGTIAQGWLPAARPVAARLRRATAIGCFFLFLGLFIEAGRILWSLSGGDLSFARALLPAFVQSATGRVLAVRLLLAVALGARQLWRGRPTRAPEAACWTLLLAASLSGDSHAADLKDGQKLLGQVTDTAHIWLACAWLGGLLMVVWLNRAVSDARGLIQQFSRIAGFVMPGVVVAGLANAYLHLPPAGVPGLAGFTWGQLLIIKAALVLGILALAVGLRHRTGRLEGEACPLPAAMRGRIMLEAILGVVVLGITGLLSQTNPMPPMSPGSAPMAGMTAGAPLRPAQR